MPNPLTQKTTLTLSGAEEIAIAAEAEAQKNGWKVSIAVVDEAGRLIYFRRMDGSTNASVEIALAKAAHSANYRRDTQYHEAALAQGDLVILGLPSTVPIEGGLRLIHEGTVIGAIGVSGVQANEDGIIAKAGAAQLGLAPE